MVSIVRGHVMAFKLIRLILGLLLVLLGHVLVGWSDSMLLDYRANVELLEKLALDLTVSIVVVLNRLVYRIFICLLESRLRRGNNLSAIVSNAPVAIICAASHYNT